MTKRSVLGRVPLWGKAASVIALAMGIGAAAAGAGIMGDNLVKVKDPIIVESVTAAGATGITYNDDLTFEVTAETYPGETYDLTIEVTNNTDVDQSHRMVFDFADGFRLSRVVADQGAGMVLTQESPNSFLFTVDFGTTTTMEIDVEVLPQVFPGWYTITGVTEALATNLSNVG